VYTRQAGDDVRSDAKVMKTASQKTGMIIADAEKEKMAQVKTFRLLLTVLFFKDMT